MGCGRFTKIARGVSGPARERGYGGGSLVLRPATQCHTPLRDSKPQWRTTTERGCWRWAEGIWQFGDQKIREYAIATPPGRLTPVNIFRDRDGGLWLGTLQRGLLQFAAKGKV